MTKSEGKYHFVGYKMGNCRTSNRTELNQVINVIKRNAFVHGAMSGITLMPSALDIYRRLDHEGSAGDWRRVGQDVGGAMSKVAPTNAYPGKRSTVVD